LGPKIQLQTQYNALETFFSQIKTSRQLTPKIKGQPFWLVFEKMGKEKAIDR